MGRGFGFGLERVGVFFVVRESYLFFGIRDTFLGKIRGWFVFLGSIGCGSGFVLFLCVG